MKEDQETDFASLVGDFDFPVAPYLRGQIRDALTLTRTGSWWSAALLIEDPRNRRMYVAIYRWQYRDGAWKRFSKFIRRTKKDADKIRYVLSSKPITRPWAERAMSFAGRPWVRSSSRRYSESVE